MNKLLKLTDATVQSTRLHLSKNTWFEATDDRLIYVELKDAKDGDPKRLVTPLTFSKFEIIGFLKPIEGDVDRGLLVDIGERKVTLRRLEVATTADLSRWLADRDMFFDPKHIGKLLQYIMAWKGKSVTAYTRNGWQSNGAFVVGDLVVNGEGVVLRTAYNQVPFARKGTFEDWRTDVLPHIRKKPGWLFATLVALSSPILHIIKAPTGTVLNLTGTTSRGKTDGLKVGMTVWGRPSDKGVDGCVQSFRTTVNGIESIAVQSNHVFLALDEMKMAESSVLRDGAYLLGNGRGKMRSKPDGTSREVATWLVNTLVCGEKTVEGIFDAAGVAQAAGQVIRWIDVDADPLLPILPLDEIWALTDVIDKHYGTAGPELVGRIVKMGEDDVRRRYKDALSALYDGDDSKLERAAASFATLVVAGKIMDIETEVVREVWERWLKEDVDKALDDFHQMAVGILDFIDARRGSSIVELEEPDLDDEARWEQQSGEKHSYQARDGWHHIVDERGTEREYCYLTSKTMKVLFNGMGAQKCYGWLCDRAIVAKRQGQSGYTMKVPVLRRSASAVRIDVVALRRVVEN